MVDSKSIFTLNDEDTAKTDKEKAAQPETNKQEQVRKMSGFDTISDVRKNAPSGYSEAQQGAQPARRRSSATEIRKTKEQEEKEEKDKRRQAAINTIGRRYSKMLAETPYDMWARFAEDPDLALSKEESQELTEAYFELAQALQPDLTSPWVIAGGILFMNLTIVGHRLKHLQKMEQTEAEEKADREAQRKLKDQEIGLTN